jgi:ATP-dependent DNA ligase
MEGRDGVFDGEVIAVDDTGRCSFQLLQRRMNVKNPSAATRRATPVSFVVFDGQCCVVRSGDASRPGGASIWSDH